MENSMMAGTIPARVVALAMSVWAVSRTAAAAASPCPSDKAVFDVSGADIPPFAGRVARIGAAPVSGNVLKRRLAVRCAAFIGVTH
ncbi:MAG: hypothetical protein AAF982_10840 [Pseudomonadota bacterium]